MKLSKREIEVLKLICLPVKDIAYKLALAPATVQTYRNSLFNKLNCSNKTEVLYKALKENYVKIDEIITEDKSIRP